MMFVSNSIKRKNIFIWKALPLALMMGFVIGALSLSGCEQATEPVFYDRQFIPVGNWESPAGGGYDIYYGAVRSWMPDFGAEWPASELLGDIVAAVDFSENSGALIIKVTSVTEMGNQVGKYTAVYYSEYTSSQVKMANPIGPAPTYAPIEADTLNAALRTFTPGNMGAHVSLWGTYNK
jgi:hypothetical protein